jgi:hypothetical protein
VLAFDNISGDAAMDFFSEGISEEILQTVGFDGPIFRLSIDYGRSLRSPGPDTQARIFKQA